MMLKQLIVVLLISGCLAFDNDKKFDESGEITKGKKFYEKNYIKKFKNGDEDSAHQFEKDYNRWNDKKHGKHSSEESKESLGFKKINKIEDGEYVDKYSKFKAHPKPNELYMKKNAMNEQENYNLENKLSESTEGYGSLHDDININFMDNHKKISSESEIIKKYPDRQSNTKEKYQVNYQNEKDTQMKRFKKDFYQNIKKIDLSIPPTNDTVMMARYIVHSIDWAVLGTLSGRSPTKGAPFVCVKATSDGVDGASSGIPFFYMSSMDLCTQDLEKDNRVSVLVTLSETEYCKNKNLDPQDPRCAKLTLSGKIKKLKPGSDEEKFAKNALFTRHPAMQTWPASHNWYFTKLKIGQIVLLDRFGGATYIKVKDYLNGGVIEPQH